MKTIIKIILFIIDLLRKPKKTTDEKQKEKDDEQWNILEDEKNDIIDRRMPIAYAASDGPLYNKLANRLRQIDREQNQLRPRNR